MPCETVPIPRRDHQPHVVGSWHLTDHGRERLESQSTDGEVVDPRSHPCAGITATENSVT